MSRCPVVCIAALLASTAACASTGQPADESAPESKPQSLTLVAYDSFTIDTKEFDAFTAATGITVKVATAGDAGTMLSKAALTAGNPEGDVMWGVDNTLLARAVQAGVFTPYTSPELDNLDPRSVALVPGHEVTPVDAGDVCINYDIAWFQQRGIEPPDTLAALSEPQYQDLLVVENPATSSPGLAFLLASIAQFGDGSWQSYWADLRDNGVLVVDSWDQAYYEQFSGSTGKGPRPLVVSYGSSPPAEVIFADPRPLTAPTAVIAGTCFHQVEFAGVLRGTKFPAASGLLVDYLVSARFQQVLPLTLFVYPIRTGVTLPQEFVDYSIRPEQPHTISPADIETKSREWIATWTALVLR